jgi:hypothetical protein
MAGFSTSGSVIGIALPSLELHFAGLASLYNTCRLSEKAWCAFLFRLYALGVG